MLTRGTFMSILMALAFILAGYLIYTRIIQKPPRETLEIVVCKNLNCHYLFEVRVPASKGGAPYLCPNCKQKSAYLAFQCTNPECGAIFPVTPQEMKSGASIRCPVCGHQADRPPGIPENAETLCIKGAVPR
jgi:DNA-directed RNA polymerase subunit RPC12/RpoP